MTTSESPVPQKGAGGKETPSELVEVYKILHTAGRPLTVPEIAEEMPPTGYLSAAMRAYKEHLKEKQPGVWKALETLTRWPAETQQEAMVWWVGQIVTRGRNIKVFNIATAPRPGGSGGGCRGGTYVHNPEKPPRHRVSVWTETHKVVPWTPERSAADNRGVAAGLEWRRHEEEWRLNGEKALTKQQTKKTFDIANRAIVPKYNLDEKDSLT